jgi:hypothetical protein
VPLPPWAITTSRIRIGALAVMPPRSVIARSGTLLRKQTHHLAPPSRAMALSSSLTGPVCGIQLGRATQGRMLQHEHDPLAHGFSIKKITQLLVASRPIQICTHGAILAQNIWPSWWCHTRFLRPKPDAHRMYAQDQVVIHTARM